MHDLGLAVMYRGRDNGGGKLIHRRKREFVEDEADRLYRSLIHVSALELHVAGEVDLPPMDQLDHVLMRWLEKDTMTVIQQSVHDSPGILPRLGKWRGPSTETRSA
jgi:hypothetical protein